MQVVLVVILISAASIYLGWKGYTHFFKKEAACESCAFGATVEKKVRD